MSRRDRLYLGTNTKMYKNIAETVSYLQELQNLIGDISTESTEIFVIPSFTTLESAKRVLGNCSIRLGAQNMAWEAEGQFTGEISPLMLREVGVEIVELGHSERRQLLGETDAQINRKVLCALSHAFTGLLCIGETSEQKNAGISNEILQIQLKLGLQNVSARQAEKLWVAYEPVWAIGAAGVPATKEYADEKHKVIRQTLREIFGEKVGNDIPILYGGSVNSQNMVGMIQMPYIDGLFIGRSAWKAENFAAMIREVQFHFYAKKARV